MSAGLVTLHLAPGQRLGDLIQAIRALTGETHVRTVSGRVGVLVDAETALQYLWTRLEFVQVTRSGVVALPPEPVVAEDVEPVAPVKPAKRTAAKKAAPAADKIEEV